MNNSRRVQGALTRRSPVRQPNKRIHILCEGEVTEPKYLDSFIRSLNVRVAVLGTIRGGVGVPKTIVEQCIELKQKVSLETRRAGYKGLDEVWAVFDVDEHDLSEALLLAKANLIKCAISNPCIEIWGLLHEKEQGKPYHRHEAQRALSKIMPNYHHDKNPVFDWAWCSEKVSIAVKNAEKGRRHRYAEGANFPNDVPSTNFDRLLGVFNPSLLSNEKDVTWCEWG